MAKRAAQQTFPKALTGIKGFDELSLGGLPRNRTTLVMGGPGTGKSVFALQTLVGAASKLKQSGIFVAFEENIEAIFTNAAAFDWGLPALARKRLFFMNAQLSPAFVATGDFDLGGMLAMLEAKQNEIGAEWVVFDGIDVLLSLLRTPRAKMREIYRLRDWLTRRGLTAIITSKIDSDGTGSDAANYGFMQFMVDCVIRFDRRMEQGIPVRRLEIAKYRGSSFAPGEFPLNFGPHGMAVASPGPTDIPQNASSERVSTGFPGLDEMLGGGLFRGSSTLITGAPGTSKTTLAGLFTEAACKRGERTLFVSFDEGGERVRRNLKSVGIHLDPHVKSGMLQMYSGRTDAVNPEEHLIRIAALIVEHKPRCMVIDPLSAISRTGALSSARAIGNRLIYKLRDHHITAVITALVEGEDPHAEATELQISTISDSWIQLSYLVCGGERNRALTIVKSRGTRHSNQVRELVLSDTGLALVEVYASGGEVLMGTLRWEKEAEERSRALLREAETDHRRRELQFAEADTTARITAAQLDLERQRAALALNTRDDAARDVVSGEHQTEVRRLRGANDTDIAAPTPKLPAASTAARSRGNGHAKERRRGS
ncbi:MAG TPA: circadian clock protein KaiC [Steroidobacteraceae bacterium]|jgi:circadian clock protein KaiC|nr:circadian clock protein KaiC [Steroidobacteraceae bacterium]